MLMFKEWAPTKSNSSLLTTGEQVDHNSFLISNRSLNLVLTLYLVHESTNMAQPLSEESMSMVDLSGLFTRPCGDGLVGCWAGTICCMVWCMSCMVWNIIAILSDGALHHQQATYQQQSVHMNKALHPQGWDGPPYS